MKKIHIILILFIFLLSCRKEEIIEYSSFNGKYSGTLSYNLNNRNIVQNSTRTILNNTIKWWNNDKYSSEFYPINNNYQIYTKMSGNGKCPNSTYIWSLTFIGNGVIKEDSLIESGTLIDSTIHYNNNGSISIFIEKGNWIGKFKLN